MPNTSTVRAAARRSRPPKLTVADRIRLGPTAAAVKGSIPPSQWRQVVANAHSRGFTVPSALSDVPDELKARTHSSLQAQATQQTTDAYKPAQAELAYEVQQAQGIRDARMKAETGFNDWYSQKVTEINNASSATQAAYQDWADKTAATNSAAARANAAQATATAQAGQGSDLSNSIYLKGAADRANASADRAGLLPQAARDQGSAVAVNNAARVESAAGSYQGGLAAVSADYGKTILGVNQDRMKLATQQASDQIRNYTDLLNTEVSKANANRSADISLQTLTAKGSENALKHQEFLLNEKNQTTIANTQAATVRRGQTLSHSDRIALRSSTALQKQADRDAALQRAKIAHPNAATGAPSVAEKVASRSAVQTIHSIAGALKGQRNGQLLDPTSGHWHSSRYVLRNMGFSDDQINVALRVLRGAHGPSAIKNPQLLGILPQDVGLL